MTLRLTEIHPGTVHLPIALLPAALAMDALGVATGSRGMVQAGRLLVGAAFGSALLAGATGALAQGAAKVEEGEPRALLTTHRTLNLALTVMLAGMAAHRAGHRWPGGGYFAAGLAALGAMGYSAYLGGRMSYEHGIGVAKAGGLRETAEIGRDGAGTVLAAAARAVERALRESVREVARGSLLPALLPGERAARASRAARLGRARA
ncbi:DUF2231 domain-containing protein [Roseicella aquatilis]|nr:DUF2231 domain-containing protein [Roseicella aquatilis]